MNFYSLVVTLAVWSLLCFTTSAQNPPLGLFPSQADIGTLLHPGSASFDAARHRYTLSASGENMWAARDDFHFLYKQTTGNQALAAEVSLLGAGADPHRKACLLFRQSLDPDAAYVDIALHGDGLTSLQFRREKGARTQEIQANVISPKRLRLEKRGDTFTLFLASENQEPTFSGAAIKLLLREPFYVGLGVCAHNKDVTETATFANVQLEPLASAVKPILYSTIETIAIASTDRRVVYASATHLEAPNWHPDGKTLIYNSGGKLYRIPAAGGTPTPLDTGFANRCNNHHGISPDGQHLAISDQSQGDKKSMIYTLPITGGTPRLITRLGPSYWHGWSPDGQTLAYCAERNGEFDVYSIPVTGGPEKRLTTTPGLDDGPDFSPDGKQIYWNSERTGLMKIWRMNADGNDQVQVTKDYDWADWFPHPSPDGKWLIFLSYDKSIKGHPANQEVVLRLMSLPQGSPRILAHLHGGQGTLNVPSWSPDSKRVAFGSYVFVGR
jgi:TolB protein